MAEEVAGAWRIFAGHDCTTKRMILKLNWEIGTYDAHVLEVNGTLNKCKIRKGKEECIFNLTPNENRLAIQFDDTFNGEYEIRQKKWKKV